MEHFDLWESFSDFPWPVGQPSGLPVALQLQLLLPAHLGPCLPDGLEVLHSPSATSFGHAISFAGVQQTLTDPSTPQPRHLLLQEVL